MGSFNTTCAISKAPIVEGQKVRVFFLIMNTFSYHYEKREKGLFSNIQMGLKCYPWDNFKVIGYPMLAKYADYNHYEFEDKDLEELNLKIINKIYIPNRVQEGKKIEDYNSSHDYINIEKIEDMKQLQDIEHSGSLRVKSCHGVSIIAKMAILEDVFQKLIKPKKYPLIYNDYKNLQSYEDYIKSMLEKINAFDSIVDVSNEIKTRLKEKYVDEKEYNAFLNVYINFERENKSRKLFDSQALQETYISTDLIENSDIKEKIIESWATFTWTMNFFEQYNFELLPVITSGQDYEFQDHSDMLRELSEIVSNLKHPYTEDTLTIEKEYTKKLSISLKELDEKIKDWFSIDNEVYLDYLKIKQEIEEKNIEFFEIDDGSNLSEFLINYDILDVKSGKIYLKE